MTIQLDNQIPIKYFPKDGLATLNTQWRISLGAAFNSLHSLPLATNGRKKRRHVRLFDEFKGKIAGVNFNGIRILDLFANG
uniref:Uncharacterized protein n=1 Tax=Panagrolaimus sp. JU765 TaxID=591449 RepID=A0AC34RLS0_9BILA